MDRKLSLWGAGLNLAGVLGFAVCMLTGPLSLCYLFSIAIAWGLVLMLCGYARYGRPDAKVAALCALIFGGMYALCNTVVYYTQLTAVASGTLDAQAAQILDYSKYGLMFSLDLLGYCLMALSTFFAGLTIVPRDRPARWLKGLLMVHGVFALSCFILPLLGVFGPDTQGADWVGVAVLEFWCAYFLPIGVLSLRHFAKSETAQS